LIGRKKFFKYKIPVIVLILLLVCMAIPWPAAAAAPYNIGMEFGSSSSGSFSSTITTSPGATIYVPVTIDKPDDLAAFGIGVIFDPSVLTPSATVLSGLTSPQVYNYETFSGNTANNEVGIGWSAATGLTSGGTLFILSFTVNSSVPSGTTNLTFDSSFDKLYNAGIPNKNPASNVPPADITNSFNFNNSLSNAVTVESPTYTVTFNSEGGSAVATETVNSGATATQPANPTKNGSNFLGWYTDNTLKTPFNFTTLITSDITLYASWSSNGGVESFSILSATPSYFEAL
jgi:uncharacterized repeat protein (TIGR02543 family)